MVFSSNGDALRVFSSNCDPLYFHYSKMFPEIKSGTKIDAIILAKIQNLVKNLAENVKSSLGFEKFTNCIEKYLYNTPKETELDEFFDCLDNIYSTIVDFEKISENSKKILFLHENGFID